MGTMDHTDRVKRGIVFWASLGVAVFLVAGSSGPTPTRLSVVANPATLHRAAPPAPTPARRPPRAWGAVSGPAPADPLAPTASSAPPPGLHEVFTAGRQPLASLLLVAGGVFTMTAALARYWDARRAPLSRLEPLAIAAVTSTQDGEVSRRAAVASAVVASSL